MILVILTHKPRCVNATGLWGANNYLTNKNLNHGNSIHVSGACNLYVCFRYRNRWNLNRFLLDKQTVHQSGFQIQESYG